MPRSASVGGLAKRGVIPRKQFYIKLFFFNTVILAHKPQLRSRDMDHDTHSRETEIQISVPSQWALQRNKGIEHFQTALFAHMS